ncbi:hypothetical protein D3C73_1002850 [compost metagenome]
MANQLQCREASTNHLAPLIALMIAAEPCLRSTQGKSVSPCFSIHLARPLSSKWSSQKSEWRSHNDHHFKGNVPRGWARTPTSPAAAAKFHCRLSIHKKWAFDGVRRSTGIRVLHLAGARSTSCQVLHATPHFFLDRRWPALSLYPGLLRRANAR